MPRKRTVADEAILDAALRLVRERGPGALSYGALSPIVGLSPSTLVQRFPTKPALLHAALARAWDGLERDSAAADRDAPGGAAGVVDLLLRLSGQYDTEGYADQLLLLREDLRDPVLRARGAAWLATVGEAVERRLGVVGVGDVVLATWQGSLTVWSFRRDAPLDVVVRRCLEAVLAFAVTPPS